MRIRSQEEEYAHSMTWTGAISHGACIPVKSGIKLTTACPISFKRTLWSMGHSSF